MIKLLTFHKHHNLEKISTEEVHRLTFQSLFTDENLYNNNNNNNKYNERAQNSPQQQPHSLMKDDTNPFSPDINNVS